METIVSQKKETKIVSEEKLTKVVNRIEDEIDDISSNPEIKLWDNIDIRENNIISILGASSNKELSILKIGKALMKFEQKTIKSKEHLPQKCNVGEIKKYIKYLRGRIKSVSSLDRRALIIQDEEFPVLENLFSEIKPAGEFLINTLRKIQTPTDKKLFNLIKKQLNETSALKLSDTLKIIKNYQKTEESSLLMQQVTQLKESLRILENYQEKKADNPSIFEGILNEEISFAVNRMSALITKAETLEKTTSTKVNVFFQERKLFLKACRELNLEEAKQKVRNMQKILLILIQADKLPDNLDSLKEIIADFELLDAKIKVLISPKKIAKKQENKKHKNQSPLDFDNFSKEAFSEISILDKIISFLKNILSKKKSINKKTLAEFLQKSNKHDLFHLTLQEKETISRNQKLKNAVLDFINENQYDKQSFKYILQNFKDYYVLVSEYIKNSKTDSAKTDEPTLDQLTNQIIDKIENI